MKIAVLGAGAWGTALASRFATNAAHDVMLWGRDATLIDAVNREQRNNHYLSGIALSARLRATTDVRAAVDGCDLIILGAPIAATALLLAQIPAQHRAPILSLSKGFAEGGKGFAEGGKGFVANDNVSPSAANPHVRLLPEVLADFTQRAKSVDAVKTGLLSGPSFAGETARGLPLALVCAMHHVDDAQLLAHALRDPAMRVYASDDVIGVAVCGAVKNVFAIAAGISDGFQLGANARAALVTRGLAELRRLVEACGGNVDTVSGLAGVGDVLLTTTGDASRNRRVGLELATGKSLKEILTNLGHVAEGVNAARLTRALAAQHAIEMPISTAVATLLDGDITPKAAIEQLLTRRPRAEF
jgi:glycerol-3-phosphate dehydrogenase (NAD(P)+)